MAFWTESGWTVFASSAKENLQFKQELPFALIGSGAHCHLRLPVQHELETAYFACRFEDRIELWPLCSIAFPAWGIIPPDVEVLLGHYRLRFETHTESDQPNTERGLPTEVSLSDSPEPVSSGVKLTMAWEQKSVTKPIARSVTILGSQHPSVWRTRGRQMLPCDHALVCVENRLWLVDLHPPEKSLTNPPIFELLANQEFYQIGDMRLSLGPASVECEASIARRKQVPSRSGGAHICTPSGPKTANLVEKRAVVGGQTATPTPAKSHACSLLGGNVAAHVLEGLDCPEMLTSRLTGRLVSINQSRFTRLKMMRIAVSAVTFVAAIAFLMWLFQ